MTLTLFASLAEMERANGKSPAQAKVHWKKKSKSSGSVGPSPFEVPVVAVTPSEDGPSRSDAIR